MDPSEQHFRFVVQLGCEHILATVARFGLKIVLPIASPIPNLSTVNCFFEVQQKRRYQQHSKTCELTAERRAN